MQERFDEDFDEARFLRAVANNKKQTAVMSWEEKANYIQPVVDFFKLRTDPSFGKLLIFADTIFGSEEESFRYFSQHFSETERQAAYERQVKFTRDHDFLEYARIALLGPVAMAQMVA